METIYQIATHPIDEGDFITANDYEDSCFVPSIAEYVCDTLDRQSGIGDLMNLLESNQMAATDRSANSFVLIPDARSIYFEGRHKQFQQHLKKLSCVQEDKFICCHDKLEGLLYQLNSCFSERFGTYIAGERDELISLDEFIRTAHEGTTYYIGGIVGYHM